MQLVFELVHPGGWLTGHHAFRHYLWDRVWLFIRVLGEGHLASGSFLVASGCCLQRTAGAWNHCNFGLFGGNLCDKISGLHRVVQIFEVVIIVNLIVVLHLFALRVGGRCPFPFPETALNNKLLLLVLSRCIGS